MYALFKDGKQISASSYSNLDILEHADNIGVLMHFGNIRKSVLAVGYEIREIKEQEDGA